MTATDENTILADLTQTARDVWGDLYHEAINVGSSSDPMYAVYPEEEKDYGVHGDRNEWWVVFASDGDPRAERYNTAFDAVCEAHKLNSEDA